MASVENGSSASHDGQTHAQNAVGNVEDYLRKHGKKLPKGVKSPLKSNYRPETDVTPELDPSSAAYYQLLIGILRWIVELG